MLASGVKTTPRIVIGAAKNEKLNVRTGWWQSRLVALERLYNSNTSLTPTRAHLFLSDSEIIPTPCTRLRTATNVPACSLCQAYCGLPSSPVAQLCSPRADYKRIVSSCPSTYPTHSVREYPLPHLIHLCLV